MKLLGIEIKITKRIEFVFNRELTLKALRLWCDYWQDCDDGKPFCKLYNTRYDNCKCEQQACSLFELHKIK